MTKVNATTYKYTNFILSCIHDGSVMLPKEGDDFNDLRVKSTRKSNNVSITLMPKYILTLPHKGHSNSMLKKNMINSCIEYRKL